jgi:hypothetical protein
LETKFRYGSKKKKNKKKNNFLKIRVTWEEFLNSLSRFLHYPWGPNIPNQILEISHNQLPQLCDFISGKNKSFLKGSPVVIEVKCVKLLLGIKGKREKFFFIIILFYIYIFK